MYPSAGADSSGRLTPLLNGTRELDEVLSLVVVCPLPGTRATIVIGPASNSCAVPDTLVLPCSFEYGAGSSTAMQPLLSVGVGVRTSSSTVRPEPLAVAVRAMFDVKAVAVSVSVCAEGVQVRRSSTPSALVPVLWITAGLIRTGRSNVTAYWPGDAPGRIVAFGGGEPAAATSVTFVPQPPPLSTPAEITTCEIVAGGLGCEVGVPCPPSA